MKWKHYGHKEVSRMLVSSTTVLARRGLFALVRWSRALRSCCNVRLDFAAAQRSAEGGLLTGVVEPSVWEID